ncbi:MAG: MarR family transcriptional regulator [Bacillota bacterium]|nr:MarR family transcriptional regulator [Bacillota bacterium]
MDSQINKTFEYLLRSIVIKTKRKADEKLASYGLNSQQGRMISYIAEHEDEGLIQKNLEKVFLRRGASITSMIQGLEKRGFVSRRISPNDERQKLLNITHKGKELIEEFERLFEEIEESITGGLTTAEVKEFYRLLTKVDKNLD